MSMCHLIGASIALSPCRPRGGPPGPGPRHLKGPRGVLKRARAQALKRAQGDFKRAWADALETAQRSS